MSDKEGRRKQPVVGPRQGTSRKKGNSSSDSSVYKSSAEESVRKKESSVYKSSEEYFEYSCDPCKTDGDHVEGQGFCTNCDEYLCDMCFLYHSRSKASKHHTLIGKDAMPRMNVKQCDPCKTVGDEIDAVGYCKDCNEYLCDSCYKSHSRSKLSRHHVLVDKANMSEESERDVTSSVAKMNIHKEGVKKMRYIEEYTYIRDTNVKADTASSVWSSSDSSDSSDSDLCVELEKAERKSEVIGKQVFTPSIPHLPPQREQRCQPSQRSSIVQKDARKPTRGLSPGFDDGEDDQRDLLNILPGEDFTSTSIDKTYPWSECIIQKDEKIAASLVKRRVLPSNSELHEACHVFGKQSVTFSNMCDMICKETMTTSENIVDVWASYLAEKYHSDGKIHIVFIVITTDISKSRKLKDYQYTIKEKTFSNESDVVLAKELSDKTSDTSSTRETVENMRKCVARHADDLLGKHSNISVILPSLKKSVGYKSSNHIILDEPCIVLFIPVKGYIPINEDPFPQQIDGFKVDVLEGKFESYGLGPNEFHEHLKMGLAIHANIRDSNNHLLGGTLGGFVNHPKYNMCGITCAHVVCSREEMSSVKLCGLRDGFNKPLFQPVNQESVPFGRVVLAVYNGGDEHSSGMEVALFNIQERHPRDGSFPSAFNDIHAGFDETNPMTYNSGEVCEASDIKPRTEVYKYGMSSGITRGSFALQGAVVRKDRMEGQTQSFGYSLKNQLVVLQIGVGPFAEHGDSGALVMMKGDQQDSIAIGIVEGGIKGRVFVTPICDILRAFRCSDIKMHMFSPASTAVKGSLSTDSGVAMDNCESMDVND